MRTQKRSKEVGDRPWKCEPSETRRRGEGLARDWCWTARSKRMARAPAHGNTIRSAYASVMTRTRECAVADEEGMHMCRSAASVSCTRRACGAVRVPPPHASTACGFVLEDARLPARMQEEDAVEHAGRGRQRRTLPLDSQAPRLGQARPRAVFGPAGAPVLRVCGQGPLALNTHVPRQNAALCTPSRG